MFPYTSGDLHLGHWWNFALADVHTRYKRMQGFNVLFPPGFDAKEAQGDRFVVLATGATYIVHSGEPDSHGHALLRANIAPP